LSGGRDATSGSGRKLWASVEYGMLVAKSSSVKTDLSTGQAPLFLKADIIVDGQKDPSLMLKHCITGKYGVTEFMECKGLRSVAIEFTEITEI
jgi:hypothetical protein